MSDQPILHSDLRDIKDELKALTDAVTKLILFEERQRVQGERIGVLETRATLHEKFTAEKFELSEKDTATRLENHAENLRRVDDRVSTWVNRGVGAWFVAALVATVIFKFIP